MSWRAAAVLSWPCSWVLRPRITWARSRTRASRRSPAQVRSQPCSLLHCFSWDGRAFAPARALLDAGATVALATDFNPGSSPTPNLQFVLSAACSRMGMSPAEALRAATAGRSTSAAAARRIAGRSAPAAPADLVLWRVASVAELPYRLATPLVAGVWKAGERVV